jgi:endo-alpha-1,4-polygalactosaminidase (GH114 family)
VRALREGRVCLAYLSIGEAEDYRGYWRPEWRKAPPPWLGPENPDWKGNFAVRFWDPGWRAVLLADDGPLARVVAAGWDGVYLDLVDVYDVWADKGELDRDEGRARMATLVRDLAAFARASRPGFVVVPQNGADLAARDDVLAVIDGLALEDTFFFAAREGGDRRGAGARAPRPRGEEGGADRRLRPRRRGEDRLRAVPRRGVRPLRDRAGARPAHGDPGPRAGLIPGARAGLSDPCCMVLVRDERNHDLRESGGGEPSPPPRPRPRP